MENKRTAPIARRDFLKKAGVAGAAAGAAVVVLKDDKAAAAVTEVDAQSAGYQETEHVNTYYALSRF